MKSMPRTCFLIVLPAVACVPPPANKSGSITWVSGFCERYLAKGANPDSPEAAICRLWRDGELTDVEFADFCFLDFEGKSEVLNVEASCSCYLDHEAPLDVLDVQALCLSDTGPENLRDFATVLAEWRADAADPSCGEDFPNIRSMYSGECPDGTRFLYRTDGLHGVVKYFDADSGAFEGETFRGDYLIPPCCAVYYSPNRIECDDATVTEVLCGTYPAVGDSVSFP